MNRVLGNVSVFWVAGGASHNSAAGLGAKDNETLLTAQKTCTIDVALCSWT